ncbi:facilitated trehalose transporter Tret1-like isoform X2 [Rhodnius prolixus]
MAYSGVLIPQLAEDPDIKEFTKKQASWIASLVAICQPIGAFIVGLLMDYFGRKKTCIMSNVPLVVCWTMIYFTKHSLWPVYVARMLAGIAGGMATVGTVYTAEIANAQFRPMLLSVNSVNTAFGILLATICGVYVEWHLSALIYGLLALISFWLSFFLPESPYWLASLTDTPSKKVKNQVQYLNRNKWLFDEEWAVIQGIIDERKKGVIQEERASERKENPLGFIKKFCVRTSYVPFLLLMMLFLLQQTSGTYVVIFYTVNIFKTIGGDFGTGFDEYSATITLGVLRFIMSLISAVLSKMLGRRVLLISSSAGMAVSAFATAIFLKLNNISRIPFESDNSSTYLLSQSGNATIIVKEVVNTDLLVDSRWILISVLIFVSASALGQMVIPWTMIGELLPTNIRASGSGLIVACTSVILFIVIKTFPYLTDLITMPFVFVSYSVISVLAIIFTYFYLPETLGKNLAEIAKYFEKS